jgi:hypothetical protein
MKSKEQMDFTDKAIAILDPIVNVAAWATAMGGCAVMLTVSFCRSPLTQPVDQPAKPVVKIVSPKPNTQPTLP